MYNIEWINYKPVDEPHCGYDGSKCPRPGGLTETLAAVLGGMYINYEIIYSVSRQNGLHDKNNKLNFILFAWISYYPKYN